MRTRLLVLGGTSFLGRAVAVAAVRRGFDVATLTRGRTGSPVPGATALHAHRGMPDQLDAVLAGRSVDVVVDTTCQRSGWAALAAERLAAVRSYVFVSTLYAYRDLPPGPVTAEDAPLHPPGGTGYGPMKADSERMLAARLGDRLLSVRAGVIVGPEDVMGVLPWWLWRLRAGGPVPVPARLDTALSLIDVRDLAGWMLDAALAGRGGPVNAVGDVGELDLGGLLRTCADVVAPDALAPARLVGVPDEVLLAERVRPQDFTLPLWMPRAIADTVWRVDNTRLRAWGLVTRPLRRTVADTWAWLRERPAVPLRSGVPVPGLSPALESRLLQRTEPAP